MKRKYKICIITKRDISLADLLGIVSLSFMNWRIIRYSKDSNSIIYKGQLIKNIDGKIIITKEECLEGFRYLIKIKTSANFLIKPLDDINDLLRKLFIFFEYKYAYFDFLGVQDIEKLDNIDMLKNYIVSAYLDENGENIILNKRNKSH